MKTIIGTILAIACCLAPVAAQQSNKIGLKVPATVPAGSPIEVTWTGAQVKGRLDVVTANGKALARPSYTYANIKKKAALTAPAQPGKYTVKFAERGEVFALVKFKVTPVTATLSGPKSVEINESFEVKWTGPAYKSDTIRVTSPQGKPVAGFSYAYPIQSKKGVVKLKAPLKAGKYAIVYVMQGEILARADLQVGATAASVKTRPTVQAGGDLEVFWEGPDNKGDLVAIVPAGAKGRVAGASYAYTNHSTANALLLVASEKLGDYEVVYITGGKVIARRPVVVVKVSASLNADNEVVGGLVFPVEWTGPGNRQDYIVMHDLSAQADTRAYAYVDPAESTVEILAPVKAGDFELHYKTRDGKVLAKRPIKVTPPPTEPGVLRVLVDYSKGFGEGSAVEVILDASGSMLQRQGGKRRIEIAKETLASLVSETIPPGTGFALRVFGHKESGSCRTDLEIPLQPLDRAAVKQTIGGIKAMNLAKTPIAASLEKVASDLAKVTGDRIVILLTDGEETCEGDPALAIKSLRSQGLDVRVNIVGYAIDDKGLQKTFESWAALGNGQYLNAPDGAQLTTAVRQALAIPYEVYQGDKLVGRGVSGGEDLTLPGGTYTLVYTQAGKESAKDVKVVSKTRVEVSIP